MRHKPNKVIALFLCLLLVFQQTGLAQAVAQLDIAGHLSSLRNSLVTDKFRPLHLRYLQYLPQENSFRLLLDKGDALGRLKVEGLPLSQAKRDPAAGEQSSGKRSKEIEAETKTLLKYFLIGLSLPNDSFWVNLRPDSPENIIDPYLEQTDIGKIMLETDLQLKKDTAAMTSPQTPEGREYWDRLYQKAEELFGSENITIPTLTRPWIVPGEIIIRESADSAYIYKATLKVMLEEDYLADSKSKKGLLNANRYTLNANADPRLKELNAYSSQLIRELIIPKLTKEVNASKRYAALRQVYYSLILAQWFKARFSSRVNGQWSKENTYAQLIDSRNLTGLSAKESYDKETYFQAYKDNFAKGEYNLKESAYTLHGQVIRSYFSGGAVLIPEDNAFAASLKQPFGSSSDAILPAKNSKPPASKLLSVVAAFVLGAGVVLGADATETKPTINQKAPASSKEQLIDTLLEQILDERLDEGARSAVIAELNSVNSPRALFYYRLLRSDNATDIPGAKNFALSLLSDYAKGKYNYIKDGLQRGALGILNSLGLPEDIPFLIKISDNSDLNTYACKAIITIAKRANLNDSRLKELLPVLLKGRWALENLSELARSFQDRQVIQDACFSWLSKKLEVSQSDYERANLIPYIVNLNHPRSWTILGKYKQYKLEDPDNTEGRVIREAVSRYFSKKEALPAASDDEEAASTAQPLSDTKEAPLENIKQSGRGYVKSIERLIEKYGLPEAQPENLTVLLIIMHVESKLERDILESIATESATLEEPLLNLFFNEGFWYRAEARAALKRIGTLEKKEIITRLVDSLSATSDIEARKWLFNALKMSSSPRAQFYYHLFAKGGAAEAAMLGGKSLIQEALNSPQGDTRRCAAEALPYLPRNEQLELVPLLIEGLTKYKDDTTVTAFARSLARIGDERALDPLFRLINENRYWEFANSLLQIYRLPLAPILERFGISDVRASEVVALKKKIAPDQNITLYDVFLLVQICREPRLMQLALDRETLLQSARAIYQKPVVTADYSKYLPPEIDRKDYEGRPPLEQVSNLQLFKLYLLNQALGDRTNLQLLGEMIAQDIRDNFELRENYDPTRATYTSSEHGGHLRLTTQGQLLFQEIVSGVKNDSRSYQWGSCTNFLAAANKPILPFHLHALGPSMRNAAGPSGWLGAKHGDIPVVQTMHTTEFVVTPVGHPVDSQGKLDKAQLKINVDMYYVENDRLIIVDLGEFVIPYTDLTPQKGEAVVDIDGEKYFTVEQREVEGEMRLTPEGIPYYFYTRAWSNQYVNGNQAQDIGIAGEGAQPSAANLPVLAQLEQAFRAAQADGRIDSAKRLEDYAAQLAALSGAVNWPQADKQQVAQAVAGIEFLEGSEDVKTVLSSLDPQMLVFGGTMPVGKGSAAFASVVMPGTGMKVSPRHPTQKVMDIIRLIGTRLKRASPYKTSTNETPNIELVGGSYFIPDPTDISKIIGYATESVLQNDRKKNRKPVVLSIGAGMAFAEYQLAHEATVIAIEIKPGIVEAAAKRYRLIQIYPGVFSNHGENATFDLTLIAGEADNVVDLVNQLGWVSIPAMDTTIIHKERELKLVLEEYLQRSETVVEAGDLAGLFQRASAIYRQLEELKAKFWTTHSSGIDVVFCSWMNGGIDYTERLRDTGASYLILVGDTDKRKVGVGSNDFKILASAGIVKNTYSSSITGRGYNLIEHFSCGQGCSIMYVYERQIGAAAHTDTLVVDYSVDSGSISQTAQTTGGIDFRSLPIVTQAMSNLREGVSPQVIAGLRSLSLKKEMAEIERLSEAGIRPSAQRLKEFVQASSLQGALNSDKERVILCIAGIFRGEEEDCCPSDAMLRDILVVLEAGMPSRELSKVFTGVEV